MPGEIPVTRVTVTGETFAGSDDGSAWLTEILADRQRSADEVRGATRLLNRALAALRAAAEDPLVQEIGASRALAIRLGHGSGDELAEGRWTEAREMPRAHPSANPRFRAGRSISMSSEGSRAASDRPSV